MILYPLPFLGSDVLKITNLDQLAQIVERLSNQMLQYATKSELNEQLSKKLDVDGKAASATVADSFTRRVLYISDNSSKNKGPGVFFSGAGNATIKLPESAVFNAISANTLVLGTTPSTVEGAFWIEWGAQGGTIKGYHNGTTYSL